MAYYLHDEIKNQPLKLFHTCPDCKDVHLLDFFQIQGHLDSFWVHCDTCGLDSWVRKGVATGFDIKALNAPPTEARVLVSGWADGEDWNSILLTWRQRKHGSTEDLGKNLEGSKP